MRTRRTAALLAAGALASAPACARDGMPGGEGLPLVEARAPAPGRTIALVLSGDGDWAAFDRSLAAALNACGVSVVGLRSRSYLRHPRTPEDAARDLAAVTRHYLAAWRADSVIVTGFSRGAELAPFVVRRFPARLRRRVREVVMLSPAATASFEFHWSDLAYATPRPTDRPVLPEVRALRGTPVLCVYGADDRGALCPSLPPGAATPVRLRGGHHLDGDFAGLARTILEGGRTAAPGAPPRANPRPNPRPCRPPYGVSPRS
jgi:type IV secretory pathway VirJ component